MVTDLRQWADRRATALNQLPILLKQSDLLVEGYVSNYGLALRPERIAELAKSHTGDELKEPVFEVTVNCPICEYEGFTSYMVRGESQRVTTNDFMVPVLGEGVKGYASVNPLVYQLHICPKCGYATPDRDELPTTESGKAKKPMRMSSTVRRSIVDGKDDRLAIVSGINPSRLFARPRDLEITFLGYQMVIESEKPKIEAEMPRAHFRTATAHLRLAAILEILVGEEEAYEEIDTHLRTALSELEAEYAMEGSEEIAGPLSYLVLALATTLNEDRAASDFYQILDQTARALEGTAEGRQFDKWKKRGQELWEDWRDRKRREQASTGEA